MENAAIGSLVATKSTSVQTLRLPISVPRTTTPEVNHLASLLPHRTNWMRSSGCKMRENTSDAAFMSWI
jgi:hypothetical protein